jgi:aspartyl-tRNA(Asn)/glutamyl-tRNA(Gln) amidotransferase subunit C
MPRLTNEEVMKVGKLARLEIAPEELDSLATHFNTILDYFSKLEELDLDGVDPFTMEDTQPMRLREDEVRTYDNREGILEQSPSREGDFIRVPKIGGDK